MTVNQFTYKEKKLTFGIAIVFFLLAAFLGSIMRLIFVTEIPFFDYKHVLHAHSHIALLGWGFIALAGILVFTMIPKVRNTKTYKLLFITNSVTALGMLVSFLVQGYGIVSIAFCTIHLILVYIFALHFLKDLKNVDNTYAKKFAIWAIITLLISTLGLLAIAPVSMFLGKLHPLYYASIQFFLHFQFNGWFTFGLLALLCKYLPKNENALKFPKGTFSIIIISLILTYTLSITWSTPKSILFYLNSIGVILQIIAFSMLWIGFSKNTKIPFKKLSIDGWLFRLGIISLASKIIVQGAVSIPFIAKISYTIRNFVIGFIHLTMLGAFSLTLLAILLYKNYIPDSILAKNGYALLIAGFILTEMILFLQGILFWAGLGFIPNYYEIIFIATLLLPISLLLICLSFLSKEKLNSNYKNL